MSVFICWSGDRSNLIADGLKTLLEVTLPELRTGGVSHVFLSQDIAKGAEWFQAVRAKLDASRAGIVVLTYENRQNSWIHFEAGALARMLAAEPGAPEPEVAAAGLATLGATARSGVPESPAGVRGARSARSAPANQQQLFPLLHGVSGAELGGPLSAYQATTTTRDDMGRLVTALAAVLGIPEPRRAAGKFVIADAPWQLFERTLHDAAVPLAKLIADLQPSFQRKTFDEPLHACASQEWLARYEGAKVTLERLKEHRALVDAASAPHEQGLFRMLLSDLDRYAMAIQALLIKPVTFPMGPQGTLQMDSGTQTCCEDLRLAIKSVSSRLLHPLDAPLTTAAVRFMAAETDEERKAIVHLIEGKIRWQRELAYEAISGGTPRADAESAALDRLMADSARAARSDDEAKVAEKTEPLLQCRQPAQLMTFRASSWDLDRIFYYRLVYYFGTSAFRWRGETSSEDTITPASAATLNPDAPREHDLFCAARDVEMEAEKYRARTKGGSLMPLAYALEALRGLHPRATAAGSGTVQSSITSAIAAVREQLGDVIFTEAGRPITVLLASI